MNTTLLSPRPRVFSCAMRDGVRLSGQFWGAPLGDALAPVVLCRTAQPLSRLAAFASDLVGRGVTVILQSVRGRGSSGGHFLPYFQEFEDGVDTLEVLRRQEFATNRPIIAAGMGYDGQCALALALNEQQPLQGLALAGVSASLFHAGLRANGVALGQPLYRLTRWLPQNTRPSPAAFVSWLEHSRWLPGISPFSSLPDLENWVLQLCSADTLNTFWKCPALTPHVFLRHFPDIPIFLATGTNATTCSGALSLAQQLSARNASRLDLWVGGWNDDDLENYSTDLPATRHLMDWLEDFCGKIGQMPPGRRNIHYLIQSIDDAPRWQTWSNWPSLELNNREFYLGPNVLAPAAPLTKGFQDYHDRAIASVVPATFAEGKLPAWEFAPSEAVFGPHRLPLAARNDVLSFTSQPMPEGMMIWGSPRLRLRVSSNRPDTQFLARLVLVLPRRPPLVLSRGSQRLALRYGTEVLVAFSPAEGAETTLEFTLQPLAWSLPQGCRLRLEVCTNDFPRYLLSTNALQPATGATRFPRSVRNVIGYNAHGTSRLTISQIGRSPP